MAGALWAITAGVGFGLFQTFNRQAVRGMDVYVSTFMQLVVSACILIAISLLTQDAGDLFRASPLTWLNFTLAGFFHFLIGWTFLNASQKRIGAARTSSLIGTTPLFAAIFAALWAIWSSRFVPNQGIEFRAEVAAINAVEIPSIARKEVSSDVERGFSGSPKE